MEILDQPTGVAASRDEWHKVGCDYVAMACNLGPTRPRMVLVRNPEWRDLDIPASGLATQTHMPSPCHAECDMVIDPNTYSRASICGVRFLDMANRVFLACGPRMYDVCSPRFGHLAHICPFDPAEAALEYADLQIQTTIAALKARIEVLEQNKVK